MQPPVIISLEGNIGAGKSTFLECFEKHLGKDSKWIFLKEPVHIWETIKDNNGKTVLANFYEDPLKYAFAFQVMAYTTRYQELKRIIKENPDCEGIICERSLDADKHIFAKMLHGDGLMDDIMYNIYERYFSEYEGNFQLNGIIHIDALPETCFERVEKRSRSGENKIELSYLQKCQNFHDEWLSNTNTPVLRLDVNTNILNSFDDNTHIQSWVIKSKQFIELFKNKSNLSSQSLF
jgi:deoxyadenosine/deoxycytidine kinase